MNKELPWQAVWVVTGEKTVPWALASAATYRLCHPKSKLRWLASESAHRKLRELLPDWLAPDFEVEVYADARETDHAASRRLKVEARRLVAGDFVQTDADILFARPLDLGSHAIPVMAAAPNRETVGEGVEDATNSWSKGVFFAVGWEWVRTYFNTGLIVWRDVPQAREFSFLWEKVRSEFQARTGQAVDQPSFNRAAALLDCVTVLDSRYNAPVNFLPKLARGAFCYHYYTGIAGREQLNYMALGWLGAKFEARAADTREAVESFVRDPKPFTGWGAPGYLYKQSGQRVNYLERKWRVGWDGVKRRLKAET